MITVFILAFIGLLLIYIEFFLPGGIMAIIGSVSLLISIFVFIHKVSGVLLLLLYLAALGLCLFLLIKLALWQLRHNSEKNSFYLDKDQEGYLASSFPKEMIGKRGVAASDLKPSGHVIIDNMDFQVLSQCEYIEKGSVVECVGGKGAYLIVKRAES